LAAILSLLIFLHFFFRFRLFFVLLWCFYLSQTFNKRRQKAPHKEKKLLSKKVKFVHTQLQANKFTHMSNFGNIIWKNDFTLGSNQEKINFFGVVIIINKQF